MKNTLNTLQRDTDITWFTQTMGYVHKEIASPFITVHKDEGIQPTAKSLHFLFTLSQSLSHNHRDCLQCNNTIHNHVTMLSFIGGKYHGKILRLTQYRGSAKLLANKHHKFFSQGPLFLGGATPNSKAGGMSVQYTWGINKTE